MTSPLLKHEAISASAGSGKTFQLAHRYIRLLAEGVSPDRINAMTFSRKAAGEIFDSIVEYLHESAANEATAARTAGHVHRSDLAPDDFAKMLRHFLATLHRVNIGTLDSFMVGIARAFPAELGIPHGFTVMDSNGTPAQEMRDQVLTQIFNPDQADPQQQRAFLEAFKQATFGRQEKNFGDKLDSFIRDYREKYQLLPVGSGWGDETNIWPNGGRWLAPVADITEIGANLMASLAADNLTDKAIERWQIFIDAATSFRAGSPWKSVDYMFGKLTEQLDALQSGDAVIKMDRKEYPLSKEQCHYALALLGSIMHHEIRMATRQTQGIFNVLNEYEEVYDKAVRRTGAFTFTDAQYLLTPTNTHASGALLSRIPNQEGRLFIDYRLDCQLDHWLLDEFQDTSDLQWTVLRNLVDEIVQDSSGKRSFFYVGDVKQAIYGWRGGNARLFQTILDRYGDRIEQTPLSKSFRSCQPIIDTVNDVFSQVASDELPAGATATWQSLWQKHSVQDGVVPQTGYAAIIEPVVTGKSKPDNDDRYQLVGHILNEINPLARGLSAAVLVRSNMVARRLVQTLRSVCPHIPIVHEGSSAILDCPAVTLLLSLLKVSIHPGDSMALKHLQMSPLKDALAAIKGDLSLELLKQVYEQNMHTFLYRWIDQLETTGALDEFARLRLSDLLNLATEFDTADTRDIDYFIRMAGSHEVKESAASAAVRVMTIHQSKGLGFDVVLLPDLMTNSIAKQKDIGLEISRNTEDGTPHWALQLPRRAISKWDSVLQQLISDVDQNATFDNLCVLYVAMTRAKQALYVVTSFPGKSSTSFTPAAFIKTQLLSDPKATDGTPLEIDGFNSEQLWECGAADWYTQIPASAADASVALQALPADFAKRAATRTRLTAMEPSRQELFKQKASKLFSSELSDVLDFGSAIHALYEQIEWIADADPDTITSAWTDTASVDDKVRRDVIKQFKESITATEICEALTEPQGNVELWREKAFEVVLDEDKWVTGIFDRVMLYRDGDGNYTSATIMDFKSDQIEDNQSQIKRAIERYRPQIELYRRALNTITGLPEASITLQLLFTRPGRVVTL